MCFMQLAELCFKVNNIYYETDEKWNILTKQEKQDYLSVIKSVMSHLDKPEEVKNSLGASAEQNKRSE